MQPHEFGTAPSWLRCGSGFLSGRFDTNSPSEGNFRGTTKCARITPVVAPNAYCAVSRDGAGQVQCIGGNSSAATLSAGVTPVVGVRMRAAPLSGGSVACSTCWGQPWHNPRRVRESRLSWPLDMRRRSLGSDNAGPEPWSLLQSGHAARVRRLRLSWPGCVLRPLRGLQDGSQAVDSSPMLPRPVRNQPSHVRTRILSLSGDGVAPRRKRLSGPGLPREVR